LAELKYVAFLFFMFFKHYVEGPIETQRDVQCTEPGTEGQTIKLPCFWTCRCT